jgi:hypothetical protein
MQLDPLDPGDVAAHVRQRFEQTGRDAGEALAPLIEFTRGHPQRSMLLAHHLWRRTPAGGEAEAGTWVAARDAALADSQELLRAPGAGCQSTNRRWRSPWPADRPLCTTKPRSTRWGSRRAA